MLPSEGFPFTALRVERQSESNAPAGLVGTAGIAPRGDTVGGAHTFEQVYAAEFGFVWRSLRTLGIPVEALEDAAQDVFTVVHLKLQVFEERSSIKTWLFGIARNIANDRRRFHRRKLSQLTPLTLDHELASDASPDAELENREAAQFTQTFLESLHSDQRAVFALVFLEQMPAPEVAEALGVPLNTVYSRTRVVRALFRKAMERRSKK